MNCCGLLSALLAISAQPAGTGSEALTLPRALARAYADAPRVRLRATHLAEARGRRARAELWMNRNPSIEGLAGSRWVNGGNSFEYEAELSVPIEIGGQRGDRIAAAEAAERGQVALLENERRLVLGSVAEAFARVLHASARAAIAAERQRLAEELRAAARSRESAGDIATFEVNLAESEVARAKSQAIAEKRAVAPAQAGLLLLLGLPRTTSVAGDLADRQWIDAALGQSAAKVEERPDLRAARAKIEEAEARGSLVRSSAVPDLELRAVHGREEDANIVLGGLGIELPLFVRTQGEAEAADARLSRAILSKQIAQSVAEAERAVSREQYALAVAAVDAIAEVAIARARDNERLARESYAAGKLALPALLIIRRDALEARLEHVDRLLEATLAGIEAWVAEGAPIKEREP